MSFSVGSFVSMARGAAISLGSPRRYRRRRAIIVHGGAATAILAFDHLPPIIPTAVATRQLDGHVAASVYCAPRTMAASPPTRPPPEPGDDDLVAALRQGNEHAFTTLVARYGPTMLRLAAGYVPSAAVAEDVVQEAWIAVLRGIDRFEGRAAFKTWLFRILTNAAKTRGERERRSVPFSALVPADEDDGPAVDPERFVPVGGGPAAGHWRSMPTPWQDVDTALERAELRRTLRAAIDELPPAQREVIWLRDVDGWTSAEVCNALGLSEVNQRVLLHRARSKVRRSLERAFTEDPSPR
jgi:RNA polymerase sigma-70 factor (ECF subfamily)